MKQPLKSPAELADLGLHAACRAIQDELGIESGDIAAQYFSGTNYLAAIKHLTQYAFLEIHLRAEDGK